MDIKLITSLKAYRKQRIGERVSDREHTFPREVKQINGKRDEEIVRMWSKFLGNDTHTHTTERYKYKIRHLNKTQRDTHMYVWVSVCAWFKTYFHLKWV